MVEWHYNDDQTDDSYLRYPIFLVPPGAGSTPSAS